MATAGVIGAGLMGTACARRLLQAGVEVVAYDVDEAHRDRKTGRACRRIGG
jgi:3-hydroxyisobutyrate dehydrogenase-like beta-hydroxyacid dehydrogenase